LVAGAQGEIAGRNIYQFKRGPPDDVPAAGAAFRIDAGLSTRDTDAAGFHAHPGRGEARHAAKGSRQIAKVWEPGTETDRIDRVFRFAVETDGGFSRQSRMLCYASQIESPFITAGDMVKPAFGVCSRHRFPGPELSQVSSNACELRLLQVEKHGDT